MSAAPLAARVAVVRVLALREPVVPVPAQLPVLRVLVPPESGELVLVLGVLLAHLLVALLAQVPVLVHLVHQVLAPVVLAVEPAVRLLNHQWFSAAMARTTP
jgi:hypothetical protein